MVTLGIHAAWEVEHDFLPLGIAIGSPTHDLLYGSMATDAEAGIVIKQADVNAGCFHVSLYLWFTL